MCTPPLRSCGGDIHHCFLPISHFKIKIGLVCKEELYILKFISELYIFWISEGGQNLQG